MRHMTWPGRSSTGGLNTFVMSALLCLSAAGCGEEEREPRDTARAVVMPTPTAPGEYPPPPSPSPSPTTPPGDPPPPAPGNPPPTIGSLHGVPVPETPNLCLYVKDRSAAVALGKAFFWDMQAGSDGVACATCHFNAGVDNRKRNQLSPGLLNQDPERRTRFDPTASGANGGPNYPLKVRDFPFFQLADVNDRDSAVVFQTDDIASSQGVFRARFNAIVPGSASDDCTLVPDVFQVGSVHVRRAEPRHTPTVINAVFNFRNFWDGRANNHFNGVNPFGRRDAEAVIHAVRDGVLVTERVDLPNSSLASQAVGPILSPFEMSCEGRTFPLVGRKLLRLRPLGLQEVDPTDSVLGALRHTDGKGLSQSYGQLIEDAFQPELWRSGEHVDGFTLKEANFSLFWGLAIQAYEATLVSDDTRFDRFADGDTAALSAQEQEGLAVFTGKGRCVNCHRGPELTSAATHLQAEAEEGRLAVRMLVGDGRAALYDVGFYNIGVRPTEEDVGVGGVDPFGMSLSFARQAKRLAAGQDARDPFHVDPATFAVEPGVPVDRDERDAVDGAFKVPTLRNIAFTGPYFHNGSALTLEQVVEFYNRGGNRRERGAGDTTGFPPNRSNLDRGIAPLGLTDGEKAALVAFLKSLTDERVRVEKAPFDHPQLFVADGHFWNQWTVIDDGTGRAREKIREIPSVGAAGRRAKGLPAITPFDPL
jgi:cytochrome c peroxidase